MRKVTGFLVFLLCLSYFFTLNSSFVLADYPTARADYLYQYSQYRNNYDSYQIAKSSFMTYKTLASQNEAINRLRLVIQSRSDVVASYYNLIQEKLAITEGITSSQQKTFSAIRTSENAWLASHQKLTEAAASLEDLNSASAQFEQHYPQINRETKQTFGTILLTKESNLTATTQELITTLENKLTEIRNDGQDTGPWDRGLIVINNKFELHKQKFSDAATVFTLPVNSEPVDVYLGQQKLTQANQYLREIVTLMFETIRLISS